MNKTLRLAAALGIGALAIFGSVASADESHGRQGGWRNGQYDGRTSQYDRNGYGNGYGSRWGNRELTGTWQLESRRGDFGRGWLGNLRGAGVATLPTVIRIEQYRRSLQVENANGRTLRQIDVGRGGAGSTEHVVTTIGNRTITESFSLSNRGRQLVIRTVLQGRRGAAREMVSVYQRA